MRVPEESIQELEHHLLLFTGQATEGNQALLQVRGRSGFAFSGHGESEKLIHRDFEKTSGFPSELSAWVFGSPFVINQHLQGHAQGVSQFLLSQLTRFA